ncbi:proprotein convertase P-domain-containing protein [Glycomyces sp. L485]|uniref:proprotein convertase P-domain-containing protein n=1 Tax=Glycomyces sp. L485 TaxID=2909235 RepID=UPI001F4B0387|nr:proprotein convertase P-domain-containing protein [Glycomyces sp. L485]MCH7233074.1 proprotein convertase P-domain-containing protein [Glycomyces sp. L485]
MHTVKRLARRAVAALASASLVLAGVLVLDTAPAAAVRPPGIPSASTAQSELGALTVAAESHNSSYDRSLFPHWRSVGGGCTARQYVLSRDGSNVQTGSDCQPDSGSWQSDFDNTWTSSVSNATIDHVVALHEAWGSGAWAWSTSQRQAFANDIDSPQLWIASSSVNSSKSSYDPAEWMPPNIAVRCDYVKAWIHVKYLYDLTVDPAEKSALQSHLTDYCGTSGGECTGAHGTSRTITEGTTIESPITLNCSGSASSSSTVTVTITHPYHGDIRVALEAPDGTTRTLQSSGSGSGDFGTRSYTVNLSSESASGTWTLLVTDTYSGGSTGTLNSWSISV